MSQFNCYQRHNIVDIEVAAFAQGTGEFELMQRAGKSAFELMYQRWPAARDIFVLSGSGNNGGDGFVLATLAHAAGLRVKVRTLGNLAKLKTPAQLALQQCEQMNLDIAEFDQQETIKADICIDALLGTGISGTLKAGYHGAIDWVNDHDWHVLALDVPSGVNVDTGHIESIAVRADMTVTFVARKQGMYTGDAVDYCGEIVCDDLAIPDNCYDNQSPSAASLCIDDYHHLIPKRARSSNKGKQGHVLIVGGGHGMPGAARLAAESAYRVGAGLVTVATCDASRISIGATLPEAMVVAVEDEKYLQSLVTKATVLVVGPGLGQDDWARECYHAIIDLDIDKVVDADALNLLAQDPCKLKNTIITPHPGEAGRLLSSNAAEVQKDRFQALKELQQQYADVVVLKGAGSLISSQEQFAKLCLAGNPGMAVAGMGDVLSGIIGGLVAQGLPLATAAELGVLLHTYAADRIAQQQGQIGMLAAEILPQVRALMNELSLKSAKL